MTREEVPEFDSAESLIQSRSAVVWTEAPPTHSRSKGLTTPSAGAVERWLEHEDANFISGLLLFHR